MDLTREEIREINVLAGLGSAPALVAMTSDEIRHAVDGVRRWREETRPDPDGGSK